MKLAQCIAIQSHAKDTPVLGKKLRTHGLPVTIEHPKGTQRILHDSKGRQVYKVQMYHSYGYINNTKGRDGDDVDCFIGPMKNAAEVFVIHMRDMGPVPGEREDEDKCMIGFPSADAAKSAFLLHYPKNFYNGMTALPLAEFKKRLRQAQLPYREKKIHGGGPGSGRHKIGDSVTVHYSPSIRTHGKVVGITQAGPAAEGKVRYKVAVKGREHMDPISAPEHQVTEYQPTPRTPKGSGTPRVSTPGAKIQRFLNKPHLNSDADELRNAEPVRFGEDVRPPEVPKVLKDVLKAGRGLKCPQCGSHKIRLMPTDFETGKCVDCGRTFDATKQKAWPSPGTRRKGK